MKNSIKNMILIIVVASIAVLLVLGLVYNNFKERGIVKITNSTSAVLNNVELIYNTSNRTESLGNIDVNKTLKYKVDDSVEDSISIKFDDINGISHEDIVIGYTIKNMESVNIKITEDNQGNVDIISH